MHVHILGICGTFMGSLALLAKEIGFKVTGSDLNVYPPMSTLLEENGIKISSGHNISDLEQAPTYIVVGNVMKRGMPIIEYILNNNLPFLSGPEFLRNHIIKDKHVLAVSGTHGKTTTTAMLTLILEQAGLKPGFLIGGVPKNFARSAQLGEGKYFVIEADEYDSAFFDKRSKFVHYKPNTLIINNIEFDHADIFNSIDDITKQFHHLVRIVPSNGKVLYKQDDKNIQKTLDQGCWSNVESFGLKDSTWILDSYEKDLINIVGEYNKLNAVAAIAAANDIGINPEKSIDYLRKFKGIKRRLDFLGEFNGVKVYDDFAHHPTAIKKTINAVKNNYVTAKNKLISIVDLCSNTMRMGYHKESLIKSVEKSDLVYFYHNQNINDEFSNYLKSIFENNNEIGIYSDSEKILENLKQSLNKGDVVLFLSNGACGNMREKTFLSNFN